MGRVYIKVIDHKIRDPMDKMSVHRGRGKTPSLRILGK